MSSAKDLYELSWETALTQLPILESLGKFLDEDDLISLSQTNKKIHTVMEKNNFTKWDNHYYFSPGTQIYARFNLLLPYDADRDPDLQNDILEWKKMVTTWNEVFADNPMQYNVTVHENDVKDVVVKMLKAVYNYRRSIKVAYSTYTRSDDGKRIGVIYLDVSPFP